MDFSIAGISIALLIVGIVEAAKQFGVKGKGSMALAMGLGVFFVGLAQALTQSLIPLAAVVWIKLAVTALAGGLAAMGYYDFARRLRNGDASHCCGPSEDIDILARIRGATSR